MGIIHTTAKTNIGGGVVSGKKVEIPIDSFKEKLGLYRYKLKIMNLS